MSLEDGLDKNEKVSFSEKTKQNLQKIPPKSRKVMGAVLLVPAAIVLWVAYSLVTGTDGQEQDEPQDAAAHVDNKIGSYSLDRQESSVSDTYDALLKAGEKEQVEIASEMSNHNSFIATPDVHKIKSTAFTQDINPPKPPEVKAEPQVIDDVYKTNPLMPVADKPKAETPIDKEPAKETAIDRQANLREIEAAARERKIKADEAKFNQYLAFATSVQTKDRALMEQASTSSWHTAYTASTAQSSEEGELSSESKSATGSVFTSTPSKSLKRGLLPGDRLIARVVGNVNSDRPSPIVFHVEQGALRGAEIIGKFHSKGIVPVIELESITWGNRSSSFRGIATDIINNNNYVTGDVDEHTLARWVALAGSLLVQGYSAAVAISGTSSKESIQGETTVSTPKYSDSELLIQSAGTLAGKGAEIASGYFETPPTIQLYDGDVFGILIIEPINDEWLPPIKKGTDVL